MHWLLEYGFEHEVGEGEGSLSVRVSLGEPKRQTTRSYDIYGGFCIYSKFKQGTVARIKHEIEAYRENFIE